MTILRARTLALLAILAAAPAAAQADGSPSRVLQVAFDALDRRDWPAAARLAHPEALEEFRSSQIMMLENLDEDWMESMRRHDPGIPQCVVDYWRRQREEARERFDPVEMQFGTRDVALLKSLSAEELLARSLQASDVRERAAREAMRHFPKAAEKLARDTSLVPRRRIVGEIVEGDTLALVAYRLAFGPVDPSPPVLATLRRTPRGWRIASADFLGHSDTSFGFAIIGAAKPSEKREEP